MSASTTGRLSSPVATLRVCVLGIFALVVLKFVVLLADVDWDLMRSPFVPLVVAVLAVVAVLRLSGRSPRGTAGLLLPLLLAFIGLVVAALLRDGLARQSWADYPFAYGGLVLAVVGVVAAVRVLRTR